MGILETLFLTTPMAFGKALYMRLLHPSEGWHRGPLIRDPHITYDTMWNIPVNFHAIAGIGWLIIIGTNGYLGTRFAKGDFTQIMAHRRIGQIALFVFAPFLCATAFFNLTHGIMPDTYFTRSIQALTIFNTLLNVALGYMRRKQIGAHMQHMYAAVVSAGGAATVRFIMDISTTLMTPECLAAAVDASPENQWRFVPMWESYFLYAAVLGVAKNIISAYYAGRLSKMWKTILLGEVIIISAIFVCKPNPHLPTLFGDCDVPRPILA
jgi:hypothetical protein